jgi:hypothetical protein
MPAHAGIFILMPFGRLVFYNSIFAYSRILKVSLMLNCKL